MVASNTISNRSTTSHHEQQTETILYLVHESKPKFARLAELVLQYKIQKFKRIFDSFLPKSLTNSFVFFDTLTPSLPKAAIGDAVVATRKLL